MKHTHTHVYFSWTTCVLPPPLNLVISLPCNLPSSQRRVTRTESNSTTGKQMAKSRNTLPRSWSQNKHEDTYPRQPSPRAQGEGKAPGTLPPDCKRCHGHLGPQTSWLENSRTQKAPDSLTYTEETELLSLWGTTSSPKGNARHQHQDTTCSSSCLLLQPRNQGVTASPQCFQEPLQ